MSQAYAAFRSSMIQRVLAEALTPANVAAILAEEGFSSLCRVEISEYRRAGDSWRRVNVRALPKPPSSP